MFFNIRHKLRHSRVFLEKQINKTTRIAKEPLVEKYLFGKNGIEIGGHWLNDFRLYQHGAYLNVDFSVADFLAKIKKTKICYYSRAGYKCC